MKKDILYNTHRRGGGGGGGGLFQTACFVKDCGFVKFLHQALHLSFGAKSLRQMEEACG